MQRAEMPPYFYTRLKAAIDNENPSAGNAWSWLLKPAVSLVALSFLLLLNIAAIRYAKQHNAISAETTNPIGSFAEEYNLGTTTLYDAKSDSE